MTVRHINSISPCTIQRQSDFVVRGGGPTDRDGSSGALGCDEVLPFLKEYHNEIWSQCMYAETKGQRQTAGPHGGADAIGNGENQPYDRKTFEQRCCTTERCVIDSRSIHGDSMGNEMLDALR
jgi:hypothetical protein